MGNYIRKTEFRADIDAIQRELEGLKQYFDPANDIRELCVYSLPGVEDPLYACSGAQGEGVEGQREYTEPVEQFRGTEILKTVENFPIPRKRVRLLLADPGRCYEMHYDEELRYHLAMQTNPGCFLVYEDRSTYQIPADGFFYEMDARFRHTALNAGTEDRIHLVITGIPLLPMLPPDAPGIPTPS